jgi:divalent metal cation (Fe/Co/Zn/Cd) transporter
MDKNLGREDRTVRVVVAIGLAVLIYLGLLPGVAAIVAGVVAAYLLITGLLGRCILYKLVDIDTSIQEQPYSTTDDRAGL